MLNMGFLFGLAQVFMETAGDQGVLLVATGTLATLGKPDTVMALAICLLGAASNTTFSAVVLRPHRADVTRTARRLFKIDRQFHKSGRR